MTPLATLLLATPAWARPAPAPDLSSAPGTVLLADVDWQAVGEDAALLMQDYLRADTLNPPGNETVGAEVLAAWLAERGIEGRIVEMAPGRGNLIARIDAAGADRAGGPLCLLSHIDVAEAEADRWREGHGPLSGVRDGDDVIWGRGALDMKGLGVMEAMTMALVADQRIPLQRDLILLAVADEEIDNQGIQFLVDEHWDELQCEYVINEGGVGIADMFFEGQTVFPISVGEKGVLWGRVVATGEPAHGSVPQGGQAPERMVDAALSLRGRKAKPVYHDSLLELLHNVGAHKGGAAGAVLKREGLVKSLLKGTLMGNPLTRAAVTDTVNLTGYGGALAPNVVPSEVWSNLDSRILPGTDPEAFRQELLQLIDDPDVRIDVIMAQEATVTEWRGDPFYAALAARAVEGRPDAVAGPVISVGYTDSIVLRPLGVKAFGFMPVVLTADEVATMHGDDERISVENLREGSRILSLAVLDVAGAPGGVQPAARPALPWPPPAEDAAAPDTTPTGAEPADAPPPDAEPGPTTPDPG
jgi:acetylornithine deacetylase/succinyl-diaminopimelate desuccinylase-like protein